MLTKTVKYTDYNGNERTETLNFHLNKAEIAEMELSTPGGMSATIQRIIEAQDTKELIGIFKDLLLKSYGVKSPDGRRFIKNDELREEFSQTEGYSELFMELATDAKAASDFVNGIVPADMQEQLKNMPEDMKKQIEAATNQTVSE